MSTAKEEKPTLAGVNVKTRKRNVAVPLDPGSFADAVVTIFEEAVEEGQTSEQLLQAAVKKLETANLDFQRYGDTLFEVLFAGGRMASGGNLAADNKKKLGINVLACSPEHSEILPFVMAFQSLIRRKPFLVKALENMMCKLLQSLDFFSGDERQKVAIDRLFTVMLNDRLVAKGLVLDFLTAFFKEWLVAGYLEELVSLLTKAKVAGRIEDFFPQAKRSAEGVSEHLQESGLDALADWYKRRLAESQTLELHQGLADLMKEDPPAESVECESLVQEKKKAFDLPDTEVVKVVWTCLVESVNMTGKNQGQILQGIKQTVLRYKALLAGVASNAKLEVALLVAIQVSCYEDSKLLKVFKDIVQTLYGMDILGEDTIMYWYKKGSSPKGRNVLLKDIEPFIKWLEEADEEEDDD